MKKLILVSMFILAIFSSCEREQPVQVKETKKSDTHSNSDKMKVIDANGIITYCDSTKDIIIESSWMKVLYVNGEEYLWYPYEWNPKGFTTK